MLDRTAVEAGGPPRRRSASIVLARDLGWSPRFRLCDPYTRAIWGRSVTLLAGAAVASAAAVEAGERLRLISITSPFGAL